MPEKTTLIDFIRHGEPVGGRRYRGWIDDPLSERGWTQMRAATEKAEPWTHIISSPMRRCSEFAQELGERLTLQVRIEPDFKEVGFGVWEGKTSEQLRAQDSDILDRFYNDPVGERPEGAEDLDAFRQRVQNAFEGTSQRCSGSHGLVVAHAGVIRAVISLVLDLPASAMYRIAVGNAEFTRIRLDQKRPPTLVYTGRKTP